MKQTDRRRNYPLRIFVLFLGFVLMGPCPGLLAADFMKKTGFALKKNFGPQIQLNKALFNVHIPLSISDMPGPWKHAKLQAVVYVMFMDGVGETVGYGLGENGEEVTPLEISLNNGGYNGTVSIPITKSMGTITGKTCSVALIMAQLNDQRMFIGGATGGTAPNSGGCAHINMSAITPGTIVPY